MGNDIQIKELEKQILELEKKLKIVEANANINKQTTDYYKGIIESVVDGLKKIIDMTETALMV